MFDILTYASLLIWLAFLVCALGGSGYLALRAIRALERQGSSAPESVALRERVEQLEQQLDAQSEALERLTEGQLFTERLLSDRVGKPPSI